MYVRIRLRVLVEIKSRCKSGFLCIANAIRRQILDTSVFCIVETTEHKTIILKGNEDYSILFNGFTVFSLFFLSVILF